MNALIENSFAPEAWLTWLACVPTEFKQEHTLLLRFHRSMETNNKFRVISRTSENKLYQN